MPALAAEIRGLYRRFLRELPARHPSILANPSAVQKHVRNDFEAASAADGQTRPNASRLQEAEQYLQYVKSQRVYATLIERYNPGMNMQEEDRTRLTARRVGMNLPIEVLNGGRSK